MHLSAIEIAIALLAVGVGAAVQGSVGFGANLIAVPVIALIEPDALPATLTLLAVPLGVALARREWHGVDRANVLWLLAGRLPGTVVGALVVASVSGEALSILLGGAVLVAVLMSSGTAAVPVTPATTLAAGVASGVMGTATSIGGPPLALLYQHREGPTLRSTLAVVFAVGSVVSLGAQAVAGVVDAGNIALAATLLPATLIGIALSGAVAQRIDGRWLRPAVLTFAAVSAVAAIVRGIV